MSEVTPVPDGLPVGGDLLRLGSFETLKKKAVPLMMEFGVNVNMGPFLVSSSRSVLWVTPRTARVRAAFRPLRVGTFFAEVVDAVVKMGRECQWGNVQPLTPEGLVAAIAHLRSYDLPDLELLAHPDFTWDGPAPVQVEMDGEMQRTLLGLPIENADWLDPHTLVVVPQDRDYVGFVMLRGGQGISVTHNASRGIGICRSPR